MMRRVPRSAWLGAFLASVNLLASDASATTIAQNSGWTVTRPGATETLRVVAYGDSIYAGYISAFSIARRGAPLVAAEYGAALWGQNVQVIRRCQSGGVAQAIYNRINSSTDRAFMQAANTRVVTFEMCGNDYLQARSTFRSQAGTCNYAVLENAGNNCQTYTELAMQNINQFAHPNAKLKIVANLYYPGYDADDVLSNCTDATTGERVNMRDVFLPLLAQSNWMTCAFAEQHGFECTDSFAEYMAADHDSNGDGLADSAALRYRAGESMEDYVQRVAVDLRGTLRDANFKMVDAATSFDYIQSDNTHPTFIGPTASTLLTTPSGNVAVHFPTAGAYPDGKNPAWDQVGHDRMGWALTPPYALTVDAGPDATILACETFASAGSFEDKVFSGPWMLDVDYGDGVTTSDTLNDVTFGLDHQYTAGGSYQVEVAVVGPYGTVGTDSATVTVLTASDALQQLIAEVGALVPAGELKKGQANGLISILNNAVGKLGVGQHADAQNMIQDFIVEVGNKVTGGALDASIAQGLIDYATRAYAAAACSA